MMPEWINDPSHSPAVFLGHRMDLGRTRRHRPRKHCVRVRHRKYQSNRPTLKCFRAEVAMPRGLVADPKLRALHDGILAVQPGNKGKRKMSLISQPIDANVYSCDNQTGVWVFQTGIQVVYTGKHDGAERPPVGTCGLIVDYGRSAGWFQFIWYTEPGHEFHNAVFNYV